MREGLEGVEVGVRRGTSSGKLCWLRNGLQLETWVNQRRGPRQSRVPEYAGRS